VAQAIDMNYLEEEEAEQVEEDTRSFNEGMGPMHRIHGVYTYMEFSQDKCCNGVIGIVRGV